MCVSLKVAQEFKNKNIYLNGIEYTLVRGKGLKIHWSRVSQNMFVNVHSHPYIFTESQADNTVENIKGEKAQHILLRNFSKRTKFIFFLNLSKQLQN